MVSLLWPIATACFDNWPGMPQREGFVLLAELMKDGPIPTKGADLLQIDYDELKVIFDADLNIRDGY